MPINSGTRFTDLKESVFEEAASLPLFGLLKQDRSVYLFVYVNSVNAQVEELLDESRFIYDVKPFSSILKLTETNDNNSDRQLSVRIGQVIGKGLHEFDALKDPEVNNCRWRLANLGAKLTQNLTKSDLLSYFHPERLYPHEINFKFIKVQFSDETFDITIWKSDLSDHVMLKVSFSYSVHHLIGDILQLPQFENCSHLPVECFVLRVTGSTEYIYSNNLLIDYFYIQKVLLDCSTPSFVLESKERLVSSLKPINNSPGQGAPDICLYKSPDEQLAVNCKSKFCCTLVKLSNVSCIEGLTVAVKVAIFHGHELLTECVASAPVKVDNSETCTLNNELYFDVEVCNLTQVSRLCFTLIDFRAKSVVKWLNVTLFDYRNRLRTGTQVLPMWPVSKGMDFIGDFNCRGTTQVNPRREDSICLTVTFGTETSQLGPLRFSKEPFVVADQIDFDQRSKEVSPDEEQERRDMCHLTSICQSISSYELAEEDKELFRSRRSECSKFLPESLPLVLSSVKWCDRSDVQQMMQVLTTWPLVKSSTALALLDSRFPSVEVRIFALECLSQLPLSQVQLFLLAIIQSIRSECFLFSATIQFVFKLALQNRLMGQQIFWMLRAEMQDESINIPFGLLLESYFRVDSHYIDPLLGSIEFIRKLNAISDSIRVESTANQSKRELKIKRVKCLDKTFQQPSLKEVVHGLQCWFNPFVHFHSVDSSKCKVMDSKMKPLSLTFNVIDDSTVHRHTVPLIFKKGDDLRQDSLILLLIKLIDQIWKENGFNFYLQPYACVPLDYKVGLINVVDDAFTIANIQKDKGLKATSAFRKESLFQWLNDRNESEDQMARAIEKFTLSCAGYCVISFILGIADRHSDNIMVKSNGQLFHIDFGHILGKFKAKFGIKRERVPFVLTQDFVHVITNGDKDPENLQVFQSYCEQAFLIIRRRSELIYNIFILMLQSGLEEVSSLSDLEYLRETLVNDLCEQEALRFFRRKFDEALRNGWKTNLNWFAHNLAKDNP